jgi:hypothetical protein
MIWSFLGVEREVPHHDYDATQVGFLKSERERNAFKSGSFTYSKRYSKKKMRWTG